MSLRLAPASAYPSSTSNLTSSSHSTVPAGTVPSAHAAPGLPDPLSSTLSSALSSVSHKASSSPHTYLPSPSSAHPLETRLKHWRATQHALKMEGLRRAYGIAEPIRREMELKFARAGEYRPMLLGGSDGVSGDILEGKDSSFEWEDVFRSEEETGAGLLEERGGMAREVEGRLGMKF